MNKQPVDMKVSDQGSLVLVRPITDAARDWIGDHTDVEASWFGGALAVEPRYALPLLEGAVADGLNIEVAQ